MPPHTCLTPRLFEQKPRRSSGLCIAATTRIEGGLLRLRRVLAPNGGAIEIGSWRDSATVLLRRCSIRPKGGLCAASARRTTGWFTVWLVRFLYTKKSECFA